MTQNLLLNSFIERLNSYQIIRSQPFLNLYNDWFLEVTKGLESEILENLLLPAIDKTWYLQYLKKEITDNIAYQKDFKFLDEWIKKYQLEKLNFPFMKNEAVQEMLGMSIDSEYLEYKRKKVCTNMQMDFYCYAAMTEKYKMIDFIDKLLVTTIRHSTVPEEKKKGNDFKTQMLFKFGVLFATGKLEKYYTINDKNETILKNEYSARNVAKELDDIGLLKNITATINNYDSKNPNGYKNIFNRREKMLEIISHCEDHKMPIIPYFTSRLPPE